LLPRMPTPLPTCGKKVQIPPDLVVKLKPLILLRLFCDYSDCPTLFKRHEETGNHGVSCLHHLRPIGPPLNPMECVKDRTRLWKAGVRDLVMELCCALHNFRVCLTPWQPMV